MNAATTLSTAAGLYQKLFAEMVDGFALYEVSSAEQGAAPDYRFREVNRAFEQITGLRSAAIAGRTVRELFPESGAFLMEQFAMVVASGTPRSFEHYASDLGIYLKVTAYRPAAGFLACIIADISDHKRMEDALRESEATFRAHVENSFDVIFTLDAAGTFVFVSPAWERHFGFPASEVMGKSFAPTVHPDDIQPCVEYLTRILTTGQSGASPIYRVKCSDGSLRSFVANGMPYTDTKGNLLFIGVGHDVTDQLRAEQDRLDFERQLLHTQKLESLGVLAGGIAHDFNNLLLAILGNVELAALKVPPDSKPHKLLEQAVLAANRAADLTSRLLAYSGKGIFVISLLNLNGLINENATLFRTAVPRTISFDLHLAEGLPAVMGDLAQIQQVIMNLITNAAEAIEAQPGVIRLSTGVQLCDRDCLTWSRLVEKPEPGRFVFLEVRDNGAGMSNEVQQRIFDPFFTTKFTGRGLGMSAVLGIIKAHSGALFLDSVPGQGTSVRVLLPVATEAEATQATDAAPPATDGEFPLSGTVLVVDDERSVLKICVTMVKHCGLTAITASDGAEAVAIFRQRHAEIDLVLMDLTMPNMDGVAAMHELRSINPEIKIILSSGFNEQELDERTRDQNPSGFIRKPYSLKNLKAELTRVLLGAAVT
jgi:PAS domain S-box-containing protein